MTTRTSFFLTTCTPLLLAGALLACTPDESAEGGEGASGSESNTDSDASSDASSDNGEDGLTTGGPDEGEEQVPLDEGPGRVRGQVLTISTNEQGVATALMPASKAVQIDLLVEGEVFTTVESGDDGSFEIPELVRGRYQLRLSTEGSERTANVQIVGDATSIMNFAIMGEGGPVLASAPGVAFEVSDPRNPDANHDGIVNLDDIEPLEGLLNEAAVEGYADYDQDGLITRKDIDYMRQYFGRVVLRAGLEHQFIGAKADSVAATLNGDFTGAMEGVTTGIISADPDAPNLVTFTATKAEGTISVDGIGEFPFTGNPNFVSLTTADLASNRVTGGEMTLTMDVFGEPADITGTTPDGFVVLEAGGIVSVEVVGIEGALPEALPEAGGEVFVAEGPCDKKEDNPCEKTQLPIGDTVGCKWALTDKADTCVLGDYCNDDGADCALGGSCGQCKTECKLGLGGTYCNCLCL